MRRHQHRHEFLSCPLHSKRQGYLKILMSSKLSTTSGIKQTTLSNICCAAMFNTQESWWPLKPFLVGRVCYVRVTFWKKKKDRARCMCICLFVCRHFRHYIRPTKGIRTPRLFGSAVMGYKTLLTMYRFECGARNVRCYMLGASTFLKSTGRGVLFRAWQHRRKTTFKEKYNF